MLHAGALVFVEDLEMQNLLPRAPSGCSPRDLMLLETVSKRPRKPEEGIGGALE